MEKSMEVNADLTALRGILLKKAVAAHKRLKENVDAAGAALDENNVLGAIGALAGSDGDLAEVRTLLMVVRDHLGDPK